LKALINLTRVYQGQQRYDEVETLLVPALEIQRRKQGDAHPDSLGGMSTLGRNYLLKRRYAEAEPLLRQYLTIVKRKGQGGPAMLQG
jgi:hypothetical protein